MQLTALQKSAAQAIVNIFETGSIRGNYSDVTLLPGDSGQLTYGRSQTTLASGNLFLLIESYCGQSTGSFCAELKPYLTKLQTCDCTLNTDMTFRSLLKDAGSDPVMQDVQDAFFDRVYWDPAMRSADALGAQSALGAAIVYDSTVHGSWAQVRDMTRKQFGELKQIGEVQWMSDYVETRRQWLATYPNPLLHKTVYRMDAFRQIINAGNWKLGLPLVVRGLSITPDSLSDTHPVNVPAEGAPRRQLRLATPPMTGPDVSWLQQRLTLAGIHIAESGTFDATTDSAVKAFQTTHDLKADGVVGPVTRSALEDIPLITPAKALTPATSEPMPAVVLPKPATPATATVTVQTTTTAPAAAGVTTAIKDHVTAQVNTGVAKPAPQKKASLATAQEVTTVLSTVSLGARPILAAAGSLLILLFAEIRDSIAWVTAGLSKNLAHVHVPPFPVLPRSPRDAQRFFAESYVYLHALLASIPNEWIFRIRVVAILLVVYALYRLRKAHLSLSKIQQRVTQVQGDIATARQDFATAQQVAQDVEQAVQAVK
jgi:chitosanase